MKQATRLGFERLILLAFVFVIVGLYNTVGMNADTVAYAKALSSSTATTANNTKVSAATTSSSNVTTKIHAVRITSPAKGQQVPVGKKGRHELLLLGEKGDMPTPMEWTRPASVLESPSLENNEKPDQIYEIIETMFPNRKYVELFPSSTAKQYDSWDSWTG